MNSTKRSRGGLGAKHRRASKGRRRKRREKGAQPGDRGAGGLHHCSSPARKKWAPNRGELLGPVSLIILLSDIHSISSCEKLLGPVLGQGQVCHTRGFRDREREN